MEAKIERIPNPDVDFGKYEGDEGSVVFVDPSGAVVRRQWTTLTVGMSDAGAAPAPAPDATRAPLLAAVFCGAALVACLVAAFLLYRCCVMPRRDKHNCLRKIDSTTPIPPQGPATSQSAVFAEQKSSNAWGYSNRLVALEPQQPNPWYTSRYIGGPHCTQCPGVCPVPRSNSNPGHQVGNETRGSQVQSNTTKTKKQRPISQPIPSNISINCDIIPKVPLPEISEFSPNSPQYASSSILDEFGNKEEQNQNEPTLKTRSLPAWVRSKPRPLSTEDDLNDLYAKVNFSKKRKNRMRNDEAAIIALSKSRSQFLHKDTDSLVDNEAVIVYDERTAL